MRKLVPVLALALLSTPALADKDKAKIRLKVDTSIFSMDSLGSSFDNGTTTQDVTLKDSGPTLGGAPARLYGGYIVAPNIEIGAAIEAKMRSSSYEIETDFGGTTESAEGDLVKSSAFGLLLSLSYNKKLGDGMALFVQPKAGVYNSKDEPDGGTPTSVKSLAVGGELGTRVIVNKRASLDIGLEYLMASGKAFDDGDEVEDTKIKASSLALRLGGSLKF